jgi:FixJ family two-component response regulator
MSKQPTVFIVDDDANVRDALRWLIESVNLPVETYESAGEFLESYDITWPGCAVVDVRMPGTSGLDLQRALREQNQLLPVIIVTGHGDVRMCVQAFEGGAFAFLEKPLNHQELLDAVQRAIKEDAQRRRVADARDGWESYTQELSVRQREVMKLLVAGKSMKHIAAELGISVQTCAKHRAKVLEIVGVDNDVQLVRLVMSSNEPAD